MKKSMVVLLLLVVFSVFSFYMETHKLTEEEFEILNKKATELGIDESNELIRVISWRNGKLFDDDYNKSLEFRYAAHKQGTYYDARYVLGCTGMKKSGWICTKHVVTNIRLNAADEKNIGITIKKGQNIEDIVALAQYANNQKPLAWDAKMVSIDAKQDNIFEVSCQTVDDCYYTQKIKLIHEMGITSYQIDNSEITSFLACKKDEYAGFKKMIINYIIYEKSSND